ncbi:MAG: hypothetical protein NWF04_05785 [Candidatus Bathyarchaeota archaeon]|nr:hypothetical protein [Candidatus Bathyarchaeota archaeon]
MILVIDLNYKPDSLGYYEFVLPILAAVGEKHECTPKHYSQVSSRDLSLCDNVILSGTPLKDNVAWQQPQSFQWLKTCDKPVLGICAGMQVLASVFGLKIAPCTEIGMTQISTVKENPLFSSVFNAYTLHNWAVESSGLFEALAQSESCVQAIRHRRRPFFGVLFHPEVRNIGVLERFLRL